MHCSLYIWQCSFWNNLGANNIIVRRTEKPDFRTRLKIYLTVLLGNSLKSTEIDSDFHGYGLVLPPSESTSNTCKWYITRYYWRKHRRVRIDIINWMTVYMIHFRAVSIGGHPINDSDISSTQYRWGHIKVASRDPKESKFMYKLPPVQP